MDLLYSERKRVVSTTRFQPAPLDLLTSGSSLLRRVRLNLFPCSVFPPGTVMRPSESVLTAGKKGKLDLHNVGLGIDVIDVEIVIPKPGRYLFPGYVRAALETSRAESRQAHGEGNGSDEAPALA